MSNISEYLTEMQRLTKRNLEILKGINQAFYTKADHLSVKVDDETYIIPSFLSLESKINTLEDNFENLVNAPKTGDVAFDFNGNTQVIEVKGYSNTPSPTWLDGDVKDNLYTDFDHSNNEIFKDFCTPMPYIKLDITNLPTDIQRVNVKKIIPRNSELVSQLVEKLGDLTCTQQKYSDLVKELYTYEKGVDYVEYDTKYDLPLRGNVGVGSYQILSIDKNWTDTELDEHYTLTLDSVYYYTQNETLQNTLKVGDYLVTDNDHVKLLIEDVKVSTSTVTVKIMDGGYADLTTYSQNTELGHLKYLPSQDWTSYKYLNLPLEEDQYVYVFVSPIERVSHIQGAWSYGILFNIYNLKCDINGVTYYYKDYYEKFVNNVGDVLVDLTDMFDRGFVNMTESQFDTLTGVKPEIDIDELQVLEINKHLNNSATIEEIYGLHKQKTDYKTSLQEVQSEIDSVQAQLDELSFADTTQNRSIYEQQLNELRSKKRDLTTNINNIMTEISNATSDTDTPIDNPKYHIRGFFNYESINNIVSDLKTQVIGIDVQYRYKNSNRATGAAESIKDGEIFSDWNQMDSPLNKRRATFEGVSTGFSYKYDEDTTNINEISFNQIDIPISQGETVDIRLRVIYNLGQPFVEVTSDWSDTINVEFPVELKQNVTVVDILKENNDDIKKQVFYNILDDEKIPDHVDDRLVDQNITYLHKPESISSGFYTDERRVIPLLDKLKAMDSEILSLHDEIMGTETSNLTVSLEDDVYTTTLTPYAKNLHTITAYDDQSGENVKSTVLSLKISNTSNHVVKLYSIFPGGVNESLSSTSKTRYTVSDYIIESGTVCTVWFGNDVVVSPIKNQVLYFRLNSIFDNTAYYTAGDAWATDNLILYTNDVIKDGSGTGATMYPYFTGNAENNNLHAQYCTSGGMSSYKELQPGETITLPIVFKCVVTDESIKRSIEKTMSFDIRTSLYQDPINYEFTVKCYKNDQLGEKVKKRTNTTRYNPTIVKTQKIKG